MLPELFSRTSDSQDCMVLLVSRQPSYFSPLFSAKPSGYPKLEFSFCEPSELLERASALVKPDLALVLAVDGRELTWAKAMALVEPLLQQPPLRRLPLIWLLDPEQQLEFEPQQAEIAMVTNFFYLANQPLTLFEAKVAYLISVMLRYIKGYSQMARQVVSAVRHIESSQDAIISITNDFKILSWNPAAEQIYGWKLQEVIGKSIGSVIVTQEPLDLDEAKLVAANPPYDMVWSEGKWSGTVFHLTRSGAKVIINSSVAAVRDTDGSIIELVGINRDVTAQKRAEQELVRNNRELAAANSFMESSFEQSPMGIAIFSLEGLCIRVNPALCRIVGLESPATVVGRFNLFAGDFTLTTGKEIFEQVLAGEVVTIPTLEIDLSSFDPIYGLSCAKVILNMKVFPLVDEINQPQALVVVVEDITAQRNLTNQLLQSQKMEMIGALAGGIAHDFNNALTVLGLSLDALRQKLRANGLTDKLDELDELEAIGKHATDLTSRLLIFTRQKLDQPELVSLNEVLQMALSLLRRTLGERIRLEVAADDQTLPPVRISAAELQQVLMNLVVNARDALEDNAHKRTVTPGFDSSWQPTIKIKIFSRVFPGRPPSGFQPAAGDWKRYVVLSEVSRSEETLYVGCRVEDNGTGIAPPQIARIFEPLFSTKEPGKGTGLGLAICYAVMRDSGGWLEVESRVGKGTRFTFYLPAVTVGLEEPKAIEEGVSAMLPDAKAASQSPATVLVVEDEEMLRKVIRRVLEREGWQVLLADNGLNALEIYRTYEGQIDLVMTDTVMPSMDGPALIEELVRLNPGLPLIMMSGYLETNIELSSLRPLLESQQLRFISKPFHIEKLVQILRTIRSQITS